MRLAQKSLPGLLVDALPVTVTQPPVCQTIEAVKLI